MTEVELINSILRHLELPDGEWFINGSGVLALHGIKRNRPMGDLDLFCTTGLWFDLLATKDGGWDGPDYFKVWTPERKDPKRRCDPPYLIREMYGLEVNIFFQWRRRGAGDFDPAFYLNNVEEVHGWPCTPLQFILDWKLGQGRTKDLHDVIAIREHLGIEGAPHE